MQVIYFFRAFHAKLCKSFILQVIKASIISLFIAKTLRLVVKALKKENTLMSGSADLRLYCFSHLGQLQLSM